MGSDLHFSQIDRWQTLAVCDRFADCLRTGGTARTDQLHAEVRDATPGRMHFGCDALDPCSSCKEKSREVRAARKAARVAALTRAPAEDAMA